MFSLVAGSLIDVEVELTANHKGQFQLKICPIGSGQTDATQAHRNRHAFLLAKTISGEVLVWTVRDNAVREGPRVERKLRNRRAH